jgi:hypothetical protein
MREGAIALRRIIALFGVRGETLPHSIVSVRSVKIQVLVSSFKVN